MATTKDVYRTVVNREIVLLYGSQIDKELPPLFQHQRFAQVPLLLCQNPAIRQLHSARQRTARTPPSSKPPSSDGRRVATPHSVFSSRVLHILHQDASDVPEEAMLSFGVPAKYQRLAENSHEQIKPRKILQKRNSQPEVIPRKELKFFRKCTPLVQTSNFTNTVLTEERVNSILRGIFCDDVHFRPTAVKIYLCSYGSDMETEHHALQSAAFPSLRQFCHQMGLEFLVYNVHLDYSGTMPEKEKLWITLVNKCQRESIGPNIVMLIGDRCGEPVRNDNNESWRTVLHENQRHQRQSETARPRFSQVSNNQSFLEKQFRLGIVSCRNKPNQILLGFHRHFLGLFDENSLSAQAFMDTVQTASGCMEDRISQRKLSNLISELTEKIGRANVTGYEISWHGAGVHPINCTEHLEYVDRLVADFTNGVTRLAETNFNLWYNTASSSLSLYDDVANHVQLWSRYVSGSHLVKRKELIGQLETYFKELQTFRRPLVIYSYDSDYGTGRSTLLSALVLIIPVWLDSKVVSIIRFVGQVGLDAKQMLVSLCAQLTLIYNLEPVYDEDTESLTRLSRKFTKTLEYISRYHAAERPLVLLLDDVHELKLRPYRWLPKVPLDGIYFVLSVRVGSELDLNSWFDFMQRPNEDGVDQNSMSNCIQIGDLTKKETGFVVKHSLKNSQVLGAERTRIISTCLSMNRNPLLIQGVLFLGKSFNSRLPKSGVSLETVVQQMRESLAEMFGREFTSVFVISMFVVRSGLSEGELRDILATSSNVFAEITGVLDSVDENKYYNTVLLQLNRLLNFIQEMLTSVSRSGKLLILWKNRQIGELFGQVFSDDEIKTVKESITNYFSYDDYSLQKFVLPHDKKIGVFDCQVSPQLSIPSNLRKLDLLPLLIADRFSQQDFISKLKDFCYCNFDWLFSKFLSSTSDNLMHQFFSVQSHDLEMDLMKTWLIAAHQNLISEPETLAIQLVGTIPDQHLSNEYPLVRRLVDSARNWIASCPSTILVPVFPCLPIVTTPLVHTFTNISDVFALNYDEGLSVMRNGSGVVEVWDMTSRERVGICGIQHDRTIPNVFVSNSSIFGVNSPTNMGLWDTRTGLPNVSVDFKQLFKKDHIMSVFCVCHTDNFNLVALCVSDEEFNQQVAIVNPRSGSIVSVLPGFTIRDEIHSKGGVFVKDRLVILVSHNDSTAGKITVLTNKVMVFDYKRGLVLSELKGAGEMKTFRQAFHVDNRFIVLWEDSSCDLFSIDTPPRISFSSDPPEGGMKLVHADLTSDETLYGLTVPEISTSVEVSSSKFSLWRWNTKNLQCYRVIVQHIYDQDEIPSTFSIVDESNIVIFAHSCIGLITIWNQTTGCIIGQFKGHNTVDKIIQSRDTHEFYTASFADKEVKLWNIYPSLECHHSSRVGTKFQPENKEYDCVNFDIGKTRTEVLSITSCEVTTDGRFIVTGSDQGPPQVWTTETCSVVTTMEADENNSAVTFVALACADKYVVGMCEPDETNEELARSPHNRHRYQSWSLSDGKLRSLNSDPGNFLAARWTRMNDQQHFLLLSVDFLDVDDTSSIAGLVLRIVDVESSVIKRTLTCLAPAVPDRIQTSCDGSHVILVFPSTSPTYTVGTAPLSDEELLDKGDKVDLKFYNFLKGSKYKLYGSTSILALPNGYCLSAGVNGDLQLWDVSTCVYEENLYFDPRVRNRYSADLYNHGGRMVTTMVLSEDGKYLVCGALDGAASLWDLNYLILLHMYVGHQDKVTRVAISSDNKLVLTSGVDFWLCVWQFESSEKPIHRLYLHISPVILQISRDSRTVVVVGSDHTVPNRSDHTVASRSDHVTTGHGRFLVFRLETQ